MSSKLHHQIVIVGGGTAGITVAARLRRADKKLDIAIIEPSEKHYYQPIWTLVGAGLFPKEVSERPEKNYIPRGVEWYRDAVTEFSPESNCLRTRDGRTIEYQYLVVAPGIQLNWTAVPGLKEAIGHGGVCSNYDFRYVDYTWECLRNFQGGTAIFTQPNTPIKCGGAPQKIMYLADDYFRKKGIRDRTRMIFASGTARIFSIPKFAPTLESVFQRKGLEGLFKHHLVEIRGEHREAVFENLETHERVTLHYDMIHVTPPQGPPDFVKNSPLANAAGWVDVDKLTLQHLRYPNVFSLGDASSLPTGKTGAAIRKQAPVLVTNLLAVMQNQKPVAQYHGYTACPIPTGYGRLVMAEFDYDHNAAESFPFNQAKERWSMWLLKKYGLPWMYWNLMLRGRL